ncbi:MAG: type transport system permease protein [Bacteroidetes bacterium]|nr:type transport system permease protein [Bacteroidota bacterium]
MRKAFAVARWEYLEKIRSKIFLVGLFLTPVIMIAMGLLPGIFAQRDHQTTRLIGVIDQTGQFIIPIADRLQSQYRLDNGEPAYIVLPLAVGSGLDLESEIAAANRRISENRLIGYCVIPSSVLEDSVVLYRTSVVGDFRIPARMEEAIQQVIADRRAELLGISPAVVDQLDVRLSVSTIKVSSEGEENQSSFEKVFFSAYVFLMMLFFLIATSGQLLVRSVIAEKANRIIEILVSSCSPTELMAGKVIGLSALGLTQVGFWILIGVVASVQFGMDLIDPGDALLMTVYFILGYLLYSAIFIAAGSPLTTEQEAQQVTSYLMLLLVVPITLAIPAMQSPDALWLRVLTYVPPLTPTMMALRIPIQTPPAWEIALTILLLLLTIYLAMVVAGRIFRIGILSTGKTPALKEILQWARLG